MLADMVMKTLKTSGKRALGVWPKNGFDNKGERGEWIEICREFFMKLFSKVLMSGLRNKIKELNANASYVNFRDA